MRIISLFSIFFILTIFPFLPIFASKPGPISDVVLAIHGGTSDHYEIPKELEEQIRKGLEDALKAGYAALQSSHQSLDAVEAAVKSLEDNPLFNAGKGAVFTEKGKNEMDASIMEGKEKRAGSVASVTIIKNPISAARAVMEKSRHVMFVSEGAETFAKSVGLEIVDPKYFYTERRWKEHLEGLNLSQHSTNPTNTTNSLRQNNQRLFSFGTVGAVALDSQGNLSAATSTGGMNNKMHGRVGDSPIIGAGTYADNKACAVSCTGHGEFFIRLGVAHEICSLIKHKKMKVNKAADELIHKELQQMKVDGGAIVLDPKGNLAFSYNAEYLPRGYVTKDGKVHVLIRGNQ